MSPAQFKSIRVKYGPDKKSFAVKLKVSGGLVAGMENGKNVISPKTIQKINDLMSGKVVQAPLDIVIKKQVPITIRLQNGVELVVMGNLKDVIKQLNKKGE